MKVYCVWLGRNCYEIVSRRLDWALDGASKTIERRFTNRLKGNQYFNFNFGVEERDYTPEEYEKNEQKYEPQEPKK